MRDARYAGAENKNAVNAGFSQVRMRFFFASYTVLGHQYVMSMQGILRKALKIAHTTYEACKACNGCGERYQGEQAYIYIYSEISVRLYHGLSVNYQTHFLFTGDSF